jgi:glycosyltransferase involved in cell wall biosynthesis
MPTKPSLTICVQNKIGGVQFYYSNLVRTGAFSQFDIRYIVIEHCEDKDAKLTTPLEDAPSKYFFYGAIENVYHCFRRFRRELPKQPGLVLTNWNFELSCLDVQRRQDLTIVHICHDEGYVSAALQYAHVIDVFIAHNPYFADLLRAQLPTGREKDVYFLPFGIYQDSTNRRCPNMNRPLRIVFIGRLHQAKGIMELPLVDNCLRKNGIDVEWLILGKGPEQTNLENAIGDRGNFKIESPVDNKAMLQKASEGDIFVLPSRLDGTPLAVMEAMSVGLVPIVSEFNSGVHWMVPPHIGFVCPIEPMQIAALIARLHANRAELEARSHAALDHAKKEFDVRIKVLAYANLFSNWKLQKKPFVKFARHYGSKLDQPWLPNPVVVGLRRIRKWLESYY